MGTFSSDNSTRSGDSSSSSGLGIIVGENYILKPSDVISIDVYNELDLSKTDRIQADGSVTLPLINKVVVAGLTISDAQELITELYNRDYLVDPQISVIVTQFAPKYVTIFGQVNRPGDIEMPPDREMTLTEAIAKANGISRLGNPRSVTIKRVKKNGETEILQINFNKVTMDSKADDIILKEGDTITVPERII